MRLAVLFALLLLTACPKAPSAGADAGERAFGLDVPPSRDDTRFIKIRNLLRDPPQSQRRSTELYPLVQPVCLDAKERADFLEVAKWSTSFSTKTNHLPTELAVDTIEHVATACFRSEPDAALALLEGASGFIERTTRLDVIRARLLAARGDFAKALVASKGAMAAGSVHAIALTANIQAQMARSASEEHPEGMLDEALATVSVEPTPDWMPIDLTAVLSTRARLLGERAVWEDATKRQLTLLEAGSVYRRISVAPFIEVIRTRALDNLCFDATESNDADCLRAAKETKNLGAAVLAKVPIAGPDFDVDRHQRILAFKHRIEALEKGSVVLWVPRGDESELLEWVRPAASMLTWIAKKDVRVVVVDRTSGKRASALVTRMLTLASVAPTLRIDAARDTFAMPCVTAVLADRRTPTACPLEDDAVAALSKLRPFGVAVLVGRDLDGEIDDLVLYELPSVLLSFRQSLSKKSADAHLKSVSDVRILTAAP